MSRKRDLQGGADGVRDLACRRMAPQVLREEFSFCEAWSQSPTQARGNQNKSL